VVVVVLVAVGNGFARHNRSLAVCAKHTSPLPDDRICKPKRTLEYHKPKGKTHTQTMKENHKRRLNGKTQTQNKRKHHEPKGIP
jgi:hypothetical protein